jgi:hypothetical protein
MRVGGVLKLRYRMVNSPNALARAEINFDAHSENPLKRVERQAYPILQSVLTDLSY